MPAGVAAPISPATARAQPPATDTAVLLKTDKLLVWLVFLLICTSIVATLPQTISRLRYVSIEMPGGVLGFRWLREATFMVVIIVTGVAVSAARRRITNGAATAAFLVSLWVTIAAYWSVVVKDSAIVMLVLGVRLVQYVPLVLVGYLLTRSAGYPSFRLFSRLLRWYVVVQGLMALYQVLGGAQMGWYRTIFGYRAFGTLAGLNQFGATMAICALVFCLASLWGRRSGERIRFDRWMLLAGLVAVMSASRTAIVLTLFVIAYHYLATIRFEKALRLGLLVLAPLLLVGFYLVANEPAIIGRETSAAIQQEKRVSIWRREIRAFDTPADMLLGVGLGNGVSPGVWLKGGALGGAPARASQSTNPHSAYISLAASFGLIGLLGYLGALGLTLIRAPRLLGAVFVVTVAGVGVPLGFLEVFPANALVMFLWGSVLGSKAWWGSSRIRRVPT